MKLIEHIPKWGILLLLAATAAGVFFLGLHTGSFDFSTTEIFRAISDPEDPNRLVVMGLRFPRLLLAFCVGGILTISGFFMQALIKNPLADPYIMGLSSGAGLGVNLLILGIIPIATFTWLTYPVFAGLGATLSLLLVMILGFRTLIEDSARLLIAGVATAAIFSAMTGYLIYTAANGDEVRRIVFWTFGSFEAARSEEVWVCGITLVITLLFGWIYARKLDLLILGDAQAHTLGLRVSRVKITLLVFTSLVVGVAVAFTGPIGFVGMMVPHFSRAIWGGGHRHTLIPGACLGGIFLMACDVIGRILLAPGGLPIGIITAILGVPFFLYVLFSKRTYL